MEEKSFKEFKPTSWSIDNKTSIFVLILILTVFGLISYNSISKEQFPEIVIPTIIVNTIYPGTSPQDIENLVTRPLEKNMKSINGVKKISSNSIQDVSSIIIEFQTDVVVEDAKQKVKDAVDKTKNDLPTDLLADPNVMDIDLSEIPIMFINLSGNYPLDQIKIYADELQDKIESLSEITRVDIVGALDKEVQVNLDMYKMNSYHLTFSDIERSVKYENMTISGGTINIMGMRRNIRVEGEFKDIETIRNLVIGSSGGGLVYLKDVAEVKMGFKERESYARFDGNNVLTLNVVKKSGKNLLDASDKIKVVLNDLKVSKFPKDLDITISGDQSKHTRTTLMDLNNTIIIGFLLVVMVLMFFMGVTNAFFVGMSVPLSMFLAYIILPWFGFTMNMLVMFSFIFALGIVVDDAIVVIENTHRIFMKGKLDIVTAAKFAAGEVFVPILAGTLTTLAPFFPLLFWPGVVGEFMYYIPATLIITLFASLIVAYIINPVFAVQFMKRDKEDIKATSHKTLVRVTGGFVIFGILMHWAGKPFLGNLSALFAIMYLMHNLFMYKVLHRFQKVIIPGMLDNYEKLVGWILQKRRPQALLWGVVALFVVTIIITGIYSPKVVFFPDGQPSSIYTYIKLPVGTDITVTDSVSKIVEKRIMSVLGKDNPIVESVISNVALGASDNPFDGGTITSHKAKVAVNFVEFAKRKGENTNDYMEKFRMAVNDIPGAEINVDKEAMGPPTGKPVNIEISCDDLDKLMATSEKLILYLDSLKIPGSDKFKTDFESTKPEVVVDINRVRANLQGISTGQVGSEIRSAVYGKEASKYREGEDQYPIQLRFEKEQREDLDQLINLYITYRDMNTGILRAIPLSAVAKIKFQNSVGSISRLNLTRVITVNSNVLTGYTANEVVAAVTRSLPKFEREDGVDIRITGEQEDQKETSDFLGKAMLLSLCLILFILITQFNSLSKPVIIISEVLFSLIGVFLGFVFTGMSISIIMTGMGVVALAGIVVRNGILLVEFTDVLIEKGYKPRKAIIQAGKARITPVILTATATILGLIPLAIGFNIDFVGLLTSFEPHIHFGGDNVAFFGPLGWTIIFGLTIATFLTLLLIPAMYFIMYSGKIALKRKQQVLKYSENKFKDLF